MTPLKPLLLAPPSPKVGRPSKYDPAFCDQVVALMSEGLSLGAVAGALRVARSTIYNWADEYPEFLDTKKVGQSVAQLFWERRLIDLARGVQGNAAAVIFGLKNRAELDWRDKTEVNYIQ